MHCLQVRQANIVVITVTMPNEARDQYTVYFTQDEEENTITFEELDDRPMYPLHVSVTVHLRLQHNFPEAYTRFEQTGKFLPYQYVWVRRPSNHWIHD